MMSEGKISQKMFVSSQHPEALTEIDKLAWAYFNASDVGLCILDPGLHYIAVNRAQAEMNGASRQKITWEELCGRS